MAGHIECYLDISSLYSFLAYVFLLKRKELLASHGVTVDFTPIFLGGVNVGSGNKPPWNLPAKQAYGSAFEVPRAIKYFGVPELRVPEFFPIMTVLPQRALCYIKETFPQSTFEKAWLAFFQANWIPPHTNLSEPDTFRSFLTEKKLFSDEEADAILAATKDKKWKDKLLENTKTVLELGAFGAPWIMVRNAGGKEEPFFGSDRFHYVWQYLGLPWQDYDLLPRQAKL
ncbi:putative glutathione S-transferase kappa 1 [Favolaschia claudopus]|uniref:Glutathione S-transferase kappa n=1 Tax=Favolaschia claudopus TaxID=2862362 RepID=A0AAW0EH18_9AGAR